MMRGEPVPVFRTFIRPVWFIQRDNGNYVPVIAVDELPGEVHLEGVPRSINLDDAQGMKFLGNLRYTGQTYSLAPRDQKVVDPPSANCSLHKAAQNQQPDHHMVLQSNSTDKLEKSAVDKKSLSTVDATAAKTLPEIAARFNYTGQPPLPPSGKQPDQTKKEYCTYWIKTGGCDFTQQGCMYKHEMPDEKTLRDKVGINYIPKWWLDKQLPTWMKERIRDYDAVLGKSPAVQRPELDGNDADACSGSDHEQPRPNSVVQKAATITNAHRPASFKAPDADHNQKAKGVGPGSRSHEPSSGTELNYVYTRLADGQQIHGALERALRPLAPSFHAPGPATETKPTSATANSHRRISSYSGLRDTAGRSPPKKEVNNLFKYIRTNGTPPPSNSPVLAPESSVAQRTGVVHQAPNHAKKSSIIYRPSPLIGTTTIGAFLPANQFNVRALKPKPLTIVSKPVKAGPASSKDFATQGGLHSSRHAPNRKSSDALSSHPQYQHLIDLEIDDFNIGPLDSDTPAARRESLVTPMEAHYVIDNEADLEELLLMSEHDSSSTSNSGSSSSSGGGRLFRTRSSSLEWDSDVPSFEPSSVVEPARRPERILKTGPPGPRGNVEKRAPKQKPATGFGSCSGSSTGVAAPTALHERNNSGGARGSARPSKTRRAAPAETEVIGHGDGPRPKIEVPKNEGKVVPTRIRRTKMANHDGHVMKVQQVRMDVKPHREV